jgi:STE24 endopeptidase
MNVYFILVIAIIIGEYVLECIVEYANLRALNKELPKEFEGYYDAARYRKSQEYVHENTVFGIVYNTFFTAATIVFIVAGGFNAVDHAVRDLVRGDLARGLLFAGIIMLTLHVARIPFSAYQTFVLEAKYGFNKTTVKTFFTDRMKKLVLGALIGGILFTAILACFTKLGRYAWLYCWAAVTVFEFFLLFIGPAVIMPLFNKFSPLEDGPLKEAITRYAARERFALQGIFTMDGSRRSTKSNAFFTGFGRYRRVALFDTLIARHTVEELVSILAHEIGHYKKRHIAKHFLFSICTTGMMFFILSFFVNNNALCAAFSMKHASLYATLFFFALLYAPIAMLFSTLHNFFSRKHEYEADRYAAHSYGNPGAFIDALKKLSVHNLSNLTPHPLKVFLHYSHPPVLQRILALKACNPTAR